MLLQIKWWTFLGKEIDISFKVQNYSYHTSQQFHPRGISKNNGNINSQNNVYMDVHNNIIHSSPKVETT